MNNRVILPFILPLLSAVILLTWRRPSPARRAFNLASLALQVLASLWLAVIAFDQGPQALLVGAWKAPLGIALVIDKLSGIMLVLASLTTFFVVLYSYARQGASASHPLRGPLIQFLSAGIALAFITGDLFNLFVAFEVLLISSYALMTLEAENPAIRHAYPYFAINLFGSTLFVSACGLAYALFGTLNFADIALRAANMAGDARITVIAIMLLIVFGLKAGMFPLFYWLPDSYPMMPAPLVALYSGMLTKVGIYALIRLFCTVLPHGEAIPHTLILWLAIPTMVFGVLGALARSQVREILSFHIVSQIGYMLLAIGLFTPAAIAACLVFTIHQVPVKASLFLAGGAAQSLNGSDRLERMGGLWEAAPALGFLFLLQAFSLAGLPPLSGFWGKAFIVLEGFRQGHPVMAAIALLVSLLTLLSMFKIFMAAFWNKNPEAKVRHTNTWRRQASVVALMALLSLGIGLGAGKVGALADAAASELFDGKAYASAVLNVKGLKGEAAP